MARRSGAIWRDVLMATTCLAVASPLGSAWAGGVTATGAQGGTVAQPNANTTIITQTSQRAIFDFSSYDVGRGASVTYQQPNATAVALNRVSGPASRIDG